MFKKNLRVSGIVKMKEKLLLVDSGGLGRITLDHATQEYACFFVDDGYIIGCKICGSKVVGRTTDLKALFTDYKLLVVTIGNNKLRKKIYEEAKRIGYSFPNIICNSVYISPFAKIGNGCVILNNVVIQNGASVGNGVILNVGVAIHQDSVVGNYGLIYTNSVVRTKARVGESVKIGSNVTIGNYGVLPDDTIIEDGEAFRNSMVKE